MPFTKTEVQQKLRDLKSDRAKIDAQIKHLEGYLGTFAATTHAPRVGTNIRPALITVFKANENKPMRVKDIIAAVAKELSLDEAVVSKKLEYAKRTVLEKDPSGAYGMYQLHPAVPV